MLGIDPLYIIMSLPVFLFSLYAQFKVKSNFKKYSEVNSNSGMTGREAALRILQSNGINYVRVEEVGGFLSDHYSPQEKVLRLSSKVYNSSSLSALGVAAHEAGHAIQHHTGMTLMRMWLGLAKSASIVSNLGLIILTAGFIMSILPLAKFGLILFSIVVIFQIITLPVEFDASNRAKRLLVQYGIINERDRRGVNAVLDSAAMTYVAAAASSVTTVLYYMIRLGLIGGRRSD